MWPTCMFSEGVGHVGGSVKTASHECQWVILGVCRGGRPAYLGGVPATIWGAFRSRSAAVGRDLPRFGALFVPGSPPVEEGGRTQWSSNRQFLLTFETAAIPSVPFFFLRKVP